MNITAALIQRHKRIKDLIDEALDHLESNGQVCDAMSCVCNGDNPTCQHQNASDEEMESSDEGYHS